MEKDLNKKHWNEFGAGYGDVWENPARKRMHLMEMNFISKFAGNFQNTKILDIGVGTGRIIENYLKDPKAQEIYGIDISESMVNLCLGKFKSDSRVKEISVCDLSKEEIPFAGKLFDFVSIIRVLKYNKNWREMIGKISRSMDPKGIVILTMPNNNSINRFGHYPIPYYRTTKREIVAVCREQGLKVLDIQSFTRIPDLFYDLSSNSVYISFVIFLEKLASLVLGKTFLGRMFFVAAKKI